MTCPWRLDGRDFGVYKLAWEESEDVTTFHVAEPTSQDHTRLVLEHEGGEYRIDDGRRHCTIGRIAGTDIVTGSRFTSRRHAEIAFHHGRFQLKDDSINGPHVIPRDGHPLHVHREEGVLTGEGELTFGNIASGDAGATVRYRCE